MAKLVYRVNCVESERGWGQNYFHRDFDTLEDAGKYFIETNDKNTSASAPDFYIQANSIEVKLYV